MKAPDPDSMDEIYTAYKHQVYNLALRMTGKPETAEDIVQETFVQVLKNRSRFRHESRIFTWIYKIAKNICYRHYAQSRRGLVKNLEALIESAQAKFPHPLDDLHRRDYILQVKEGCLLGLLRCLAFHQRIAFILNVIFSIPVAHVARIIGKSPATTHSLIHRARKNIKAFLCKHCSHYDPNNLCQCKNLVAFSLKKGWISSHSEGLLPKIETEIAGLKEEIQLYKTLPDHSLPPDFDQKLSALIHKSDILIFSRKKVKE